MVVPRSRRFAVICFVAVAIPWGINVVLERDIKRREAQLAQYTRQELVAYGMHVIAGPGFAVYPSADDSGRILVAKVVVGADSMRTFDRTAVLFFTHNGLDQQRVFRDWQARCAAKPGLCRVQADSVTVRHECLEITARLRIKRGDFQVLCRSGDGRIQARFAGSPEQYTEFRGVIERTFSSSSGGSS
jgi:hypothetical protein